ncbi:MAG: polyphosphate polymerase domain-containing protein [Bacteroidales bacterium]|nr:polyphosphate polymerase domain-containing protein [Bacteroidales bacterium]
MNTNSIEKIQTQIEQLVSAYSPITLAEMDAVELMNRLDTKYFFTVSNLITVLKEALPYYRILEINGKRQFQYYTRYFDTPEFQLYHDHHNGRLNRYKIRQRRYDVTGKEYFEIKYKNNKGQTLKKRIENTQSEVFNPNAISFLEKNTPFNAKFFDEVLQNKFIRITLVNKNFTERATLDYALEFASSSQTIQYPQVGILEIKQDFSVRCSPLKEIMHQLHTNPCSLSKYCTGVVSLYPRQVKANAFKPTILKLHNL